MSYLPTHATQLANEWTLVAYGDISAIRPTVTVRRSSKTRAV